MCDDRLGTFDQARHVCFERLSEDDEDQFVEKRKATHVHLQIGLGLP